MSSSLEQMGGQQGILEPEYTEQSMKCLASGVARRVQAQVE